MTLAALEDLLARLTPEAELGGTRVVERGLKDRPLVDQRPRRRCFGLRARPLPRRKVQPAVRRQRGRAGYLMLMACASLQAAGGQGRL